ncbi:MAG: hypothetical protein ABI352_07810 [Candidatus Dormibacter sp.]
MAAERTERIQFVVQLHEIDGSFRWVDVKRLSRTPRFGKLPEDALAGLLDHPAYRDHYAGQDSETDAPIHGPYRLDALSVGSFETVTAAAAEAILRAWLDLVDPLGRKQSADLEAVFELIRNAARCFHLRNPDDSAQHDWGWVVGMGGFVELVLADADWVTLIVASDD